MKPTDTDIPLLAVDFDGTLVHTVWPRKGTGNPIWENIEKVKAAQAEGWEAVVHTSRPWWDHDKIVEALVQMGLPGLRVQCGKFRLPPT